MGGDRLGRTAGCAPVDLSDSEMLRLRTDNKGFLLVFGPFELWAEWLLDCDSDFDILPVPDLVRLAFR